MKRLLKWLGLRFVYLLIALCLAITIIPPFLDRIYYQGERSAHFDGAHFFNPDGEDTARPPTGGKSRASFALRWLRSNDDRATWPDTVSITPAKPAPRVEGDAMRVTWVGHATILVQTAGLNILTDPIWSERAGMLGVGPKRVVEPGIRFEDLPKVDLVVVSHNHYDHMDLDTLRRLWERDRPLILTSLGNDTLIRSTGAEAKALDWGQKLAIKPGVDVIVSRNHHWSTRWGVDRNRALWSSFVIRTPGGNIFFAGDTGMGDGKWPEEAARHGPVRLAIIPIGAFRFGPGMMANASHIGPIQAAEVFRRLGASFALPMHYGTFQLSFEAIDTPPKMLAEVLKCHSIAAERFAAHKQGEMIDVPAYSKPVLTAASDTCLTAPAITSLK